MTNLWSFKDPKLAGMALDPITVINLDTGERLEDLLVATLLVAVSLPKNLTLLEGEVVLL